MDHNEATTAVDGFASGDGGRRLLEQRRRSTVTRAAGNQGGLFPLLPRCSELPNLAAIGASAR